MLLLASYVNISAVKSHLKMLFDHDILINATDRWSPCWWSGPHQWSLHSPASAGKTGRFKKRAPLAKMCIYSWFKVDSVSPTDCIVMEFCNRHPTFLSSAAETKDPTKPAPKSTLSESSRPSSRCASFAASSTAAASSTSCLITGCW